MGFLLSDKGLYYTYCFPFFLSCQEAQSKINGQMMIAAREVEGGE